MSEKKFPLELLRELVFEYDEGYASRHPPGFTLLANKYANIMSGSDQKYPVKLNDLVFREEATGRCWRVLYVSEIVHEGNEYNPEDPWDRGPWFNMMMEPDKPEIACFEVVPRVVQAIEYDPVPSKEKAPGDEPGAEEPSE